MIGNDHNQNATDAFLAQIRPEDVQNVTAAGVAVTFRDPVETEKKRWELELEKNRARYNPLFYGNFHDKNQRRA